MKKKPSEATVFRAIAGKLARDLLEIAELAMPDTYFATDSRCRHARRILKLLGRIAS